MVTTVAGGTIRGATATAASMMHQHGNENSLGDGVATMLACIGFHLLTAVVEVCLAYGLGVDVFQGVTTTFLAGREPKIFIAMLLHHNNMTVWATERREFQCFNPFLDRMNLRQGISTAFSRLLTTARAAIVVASLFLFL